MLYLNQVTSLVSTASIPGPPNIFFYSSNVTGVSFNAVMKARIFFSSLMRSSIRYDEKVKTSVRYDEKIQASVNLNDT